MTEIHTRADRHRGAPARPAELRWQLLDDLTCARETYGLKDRTLAVLRALLSFLPRQTDGRLTVFPSNKSLSERLHGMPESTLRRHLSRLSDVGIIQRRDSPNRKRYRVGRALDLTFGLDLSPLFAAAQSIRAAAAEAGARLHQLRSLRARIRTRLAALPQDDASRPEVARKLRRKLPPEALEALLSSLPADAPTPETSGTDSQNERHIQTENRSIKKTPPPEDAEQIAMQAIAQMAQTVGAPLRSQRDIEQVGRLGSQALGVGGAWGLARHHFGPAWATMILTYLMRLNTPPQNPDRYLTALVRRARSGDFDLIAALGRAPKLPAGNFSDDGADKVAGRQLAPC